MLYYDAESGNRPSVSFSSAKDEHGAVVSMGLTDRAIFCENVSVKAQDIFWAISDVHEVRDMLYPTEQRN